MSDLSDERVRAIAGLAGYDDADLYGARPEYWPWDVWAVRLAREVLALRAELAGTTASRDYYADATKRALTDHAQAEARVAPLLSCDNVDGGE